MCGGADGAAARGGRKGLRGGEADGAAGAGGADRAAARGADGAGRQTGLQREGADAVMATSLGVRVRPFWDNSSGQEHNLDASLKKNL